MKRSTMVLAIISLAVVGALVGLVNTVGSQRSAGTAAEGGFAEADQVQRTSPEVTELNDSTSVVPRRSNGEHNKQGQDEDQKQQIVEARRMYSAEEIATSRKEVKEEATRYVHDVYSLLIGDLGLTLSQKDALIALLIDAETAATRTAYSSGEGIDEQELSNRIAAIIGESKAQQFLALDRYRDEYAETQKVQTLLKQNDVPLTDTQVDGLLRVLVDVRNQVDTQLPANIDRGSMESLEHRLDEMDLYERLVLELAPSVLTARQVEHLFERYQALSYQRAYVLELQREARANDPANEHLPTYYPPRN